MDGKEQTTSWKNVGNWHWVDMNCLPYAQSYFSKTLSAHTTEGDLSVTFEKVSGDCDLNQRKSKIINIYDLEIKGIWKLVDGGIEIYKGTIEIPEFMHDTTMSELVINLSMDGEKQEIKNLVRAVASPLIKTLFSGFSADMMTGIHSYLTRAHSKDVYISQGDMTGHPVKEAYSPKPIAAPVAIASPSTGKQLGSLVTITQTVTFQCTAADLFKVLTDPKRIELWSRSRDVGFVLKADEPFSLFGANVTGSVIEWVENRSLVMEWRLKAWPSSHTSRVVLTLSQGSQSTDLKLVQTNVPIGEKGATETNWENYYWNSIKRTFGYGSVGL